MTLITMPGRLYSGTLAENKSFCTNCPNYYCYYGSVEREFIKSSLFTWHCRTFLFFRTTVILIGSAFKEECSWMKM